MDDIGSRLERLLREEGETLPPVSVRKVDLPKAGKSTAGDKSVRKVTQTSDKPQSKPLFKNNEQRIFVVVTQDFSGLGWGKKLQEEGEQVVVAYKMGEKEESPEEFKQVGEGWVPRIELDKAIAELQSPKTYWIFSENHLTDVAEQLRKKGQKVFGTSTLGEKMEHDRAYGVKVAKESGLDTPETKEFSTREEGLKFLDANPDTAYVFKPDDAVHNRSTYVPYRERSKDANRELYHYLKHAAVDGTYILQERKYGVEVNVEVWMNQGEPFFAFATLENKRKGIHDLGEMAGCAGDVAFPVPLDGELVKKTVGKMFPFYKKEKYTGFADVNVIIGDQAVWFLEVCNRFGYNSHPNLFLALGLDGFGNVMADWMDGKTKGMYDRFRQGFGVSISLQIEHEAAGLPLHIDTHHCKRYFPFDGYKDGDDLLLAGYSNDVGIFTDFDYTLTGAAEAVVQKLFYNEAVSFSQMSFRDDLGERNYANAPIKRYEALQAMGLL